MSIFIYDWNVSSRWNISDCYQMESLHTRLVRIMHPQWYYFCCVHWNWNFYCLYHISLFSFDSIVIFAGNESPGVSITGQEMDNDPLPNEISAPYEVPQFPIEQIEKKLQIQRHLNVKWVNHSIFPSFYSRCRNSTRTKMANKCIWVACHLNQLRGAHLGVECYDFQSIISFICGDVISVANEIRFRVESNAFHS